MYSDHIKQLLEPLGVYDLAIGAGAAEIDVIGEQLDAVFDRMEIMACEAVIPTAGGFGLTSYEELLPYRPAYLTLDDRRRALLALLRIREGCFTKKLLQDTISGCGIAATIEEGAEALTAVISFPQNRGIPDGFELLKSRIENIVPCHLSVSYRFIYSTWQQLMALLIDWSDAESSCASWRDIEILE